MARETRPFTGRQFLMVMVIGFGVVIAANLAMAWQATRTHPGLVVPSSYVASQNFNEGLDAGRAQQQLGWDVSAALAGDRITVRALNALGNGLDGARVELAFRHPLRDEAPRAVALVEGETGRFSARHGLPPGLWDAEIKVVRGSDSFFLRERVSVAG